MADEVRRVAGEGVPRGDVLREPGPARSAELALRPLGPVLAGVRGRAAPSCACTSARRRSSWSRAEDAPIDVLITLSADEHRPGRRRPDLVAGAPRSSPTLKVALSEGGIGWIPYFLERIDYVYEHHQAWTGQDFGDKLPSRCSASASSRASSTTRPASKMRHDIGIDTITWECDYPHSDCTWPTSPERSMKSLDGVPDDEINKITHLNAMRDFHFDPVRTPATRAVHGGRAAGRGHRRRHRDAPRSQDLQRKGRPRRRPARHQGQGHPLTRIPHRNPESA